MMLNLLLHTTPIPFVSCFSNE